MLKQLSDVVRNFNKASAEESDTFLDTRVKPVVRIINGALDEDPASPNAIVLNGRIDPATLRFLKVDESYQRPADATEVAGRDRAERRPPISHQCVSDGVSTGHPDAGNAPAGVASGVSPAPVSVDATVLLPVLPGDGNYFGEELPALLDRRSAA